MLIIGTKSIIAAIQSKKIVFKTCIAANGKFPTKFLYAMDTHTQSWLGECQKNSNRLMVNDCLIVWFDKWLETVLNSTPNVTLPPKFIKPSPKKPMPELTPKPGDNGKRKNNKRKTNKVGEEHVIKNAAPITEFLMKDDDVWKCNLAGKCTRDRPKWDNNTFMCTRWYICGECFRDCKNKASHVGACAVPSTKRNEFKNYLGKVR